MEAKVVRAGVERYMGGGYRGLEDVLAVQGFGFVVEMAFLAVASVGRRSTERVTSVVAVGVGVVLTAVERRFFEGFFCLCSPDDFNMTGWSDGLPTATFFDKV